MKISKRRLEVTLMTLDVLDCKGGVVRGLMVGGTNDCPGSRLMVLGEGKCLQPSWQDLDDRSRLWEQDYGLVSGGWKLAGRKTTEYVRASRGRGSSGVDDGMKCGRRGLSGLNVTVNSVESRNEAFGIPAMNPK